MPPINPITAYNCVFIFPIHNGMARESNNHYEATRKYWKVKDEFRNRNSIALGILNQESVASYIINTWIYDNTNDRWFFEGQQMEDLMGFDCRRVIAQASDYWRFGNYLIAEFDGNGYFRLLRGNGQNANWLHCHDLINGHVT